MCMGVPKRRLTGKEVRRVKKDLRKQLSSKEIARRAILSISTELPSDWDDFVDLKFDRVMFYKKLGPKQYECHCECGGVYILTSVRSGSYIKCPECNRNVLMKDSTRKKDGIARFDQRLCFCYLQRHGEDLVGRLFVGYKNSIYANGNYVEKVLNFVEEHRQYLFSQGNYYGFRPIWDGTYERWREGCGRSHGVFWTAWCVDYELIYTYDRNLSEILNGTPFKYSMLDKATCYNHVQPLKYLMSYRRNPKIEMLYKLNLFMLARQFFENTTVSYNLSKIKSPKDLGIETKEDFKECCWLTYEQIIARKEVKLWSSYQEHGSIAVDFIKIWNFKSGNDMKYSFITREGLFNYFLTQLDVLSGKDVIEKIRNFLNDYSDYISACHHLKVDLNDTMNSKPKDLKKAHDWAIAHDKAKETKVYDPQIKAVWKKYRKFVEFCDEEYSLVLPKSSVEIIEEGIRLNHCVGRYCERVAKGESIILFLRKNDALMDSFYTVEIKPDMLNLDIVQCRGYKNDENENPKVREKVDAFCARYALWFNKRKVSISGDNIKVKYYKAVRKRNGRYISNFDRKTEFKIGEVVTAKLDNNPDSVHVEGLHIASLQFAQKFGDSWKDVAILEVEVDIHDVIVPDALDQVRTSKMKILREVPMVEMGEWGQRHLEVV